MTINKINNTIKGLYHLIFNTDFKIGNSLIPVWRFMLFSWMVVQLVLMLIGGITSTILRIF